jgi:hypothetical protein
MPGYTKFDNPVLEAVLTSGFTKRQLKILLLVIRFSAGCQKTYAVLRRNDYAYAGISPYCITGELEKLVRLQVIRWDPGRDLVWINSRLKEWQVDRVGENPGENFRRFFKIANKNLPKWQLSVCQNSNPSIKKKENINKLKYKSFLKLLSEYFLKVAPLTGEETLVLRDLADRYSPGLMADALDETSRSDSRSFSHFLKTLDGMAGRDRPRRAGMRSARSIIQQRMKRPPRP